MEPTFSAPAYLQENCGHHKTKKYKFSRSSIFPFKDVIIGSAPCSSVIDANIR
jgi:hypothetical protein